MGVKNSYSPSWILHELHDTHPGISRMKSLARSYMWWPNMDQCLENEVKTCDVCQSQPRSTCSLTLYTHGSGHQAPGHEFMWTMQVRFWERCS